MSRRTGCQHCGRPPLYYADCDTFGCPGCDVWTERPHCDGRACEYFAATPDKPSAYTGTVEDVCGRGP